MRPHARSLLELRSDALWETHAWRRTWGTEEEEVFSEKLPFKTIFA